MQGRGRYLADTRWVSIPGPQLQTGTQRQPICSGWMGLQEGQEDTVKAGEQRFRAQDIKIWTCAGSVRAGVPGGDAMRRADYSPSPKTNIDEPAFRAMYCSSFAVKVIGEEAILPPRFSVRRFLPVNESSTTM